MDWLTRISVGEWLAVIAAIGGVAAWAIRTHRKMERAAEDTADLRRDMDSHLFDTQEKIERFIRVEIDVKNLDDRLQELAADFKDNRDASRQERRMVISAIDALRKDLDVRLAEIRALVKLAP